MSKCPHHLNVFLKASLRQRSDYSEDTGSQKCEVFILQSHLVHSATFIWPALIDQAKRRHRALQRLLYLINNMSSSQTAAAHPNQRGWNLSLALPDQKHPAPRRYRTDRRVITWLFESELTVWIRTDCSLFPTSWRRAKVFRATDKPKRRRPLSCWRPRTTRWVNNRSLLMYSYATISRTVKPSVVQVVSAVLYETALRRKVKIFIFWRWWSLISLQLLTFLTHAVLQLGAYCCSSGISSINDWELWCSDITKNGARWETVVPQTKWLFHHIMKYFHRNIVCVRRSKVKLVIEWQGVMGNILWSLCFHKALCPIRLVFSHLVSYFCRQIQQNWWSASKIKPSQNSLFW